uniref:Muscle-specific protein n=1 Tax=Heterorhabditis bacteriophora TaxID=37862 RepID=A0A1I7XJM6_HETBA
MISQLSMMKADMRNANAAMAGELAPLARQKAATVILEGKDIAAKEVLTHEEHRLVKQRCNEMETRLSELEKLAEQRKSVGTQQISQDIQNLQSWFSSRAFPFLAQHGDIGGNFPDAKDFVAAHKEFATEVVNRDASVISVLSKKPEMSNSEKIAVKEFEENYEKLKDTLENRIQLGNTYEQVHKFAKDLESSFDALTSLLDTNRDFTNERVAAQMNNVFQMIQETLGQEKHQGEKFIANAEQIGRSDQLLNVQRAVQSVKNIITDHDHRFTYVTQKWLEWQQSKSELKRLEHCVDEVQMWQEEAWEIVRLLNHTNVTTVQETEGLQKRIKEFQETLGHQSRKIEEAMKYTQSMNLIIKLVIRTIYEACHGNKSTAETNRRVSERTRE